MPQDRLGNGELAVLLMRLFAALTVCLFLTLAPSAHPPATLGTYSVRYLWVDISPRGPQLPAHRPHLTCPGAFQGKWGHPDRDGGCRSATRGRSQRLPKTLPTTTEGTVDCPFVWRIRLQHVLPVYLLILLVPSRDPHGNFDPLYRPATRSGDRTRQAGRITLWKKCLRES